MDVSNGSHFTTIMASSLFGCCGRGWYSVIQAHILTSGHLSLAEEGSGIPQLGLVVAGDVVLLGDKRSHRELIVAAPRVPVVIVAVTAVGVVLFPAVVSIFCCDVQLIERWINLLVETVNF